MTDKRLRLLVKTHREATSGRLAMGDGLKLTPLMPHIERASALGMAGRPVWKLAESASDQNPWDACHALVGDGLGIAGGDVAVAEPDFAQGWLWTNANRQSFAFAGCAPADANSSIYAVGQPDLWFADKDHSQLEEMRSQIDFPDANAAPRDIVRIAHLDTGYDAQHESTPEFLVDKELHRNFVDDDRPNDATDRRTALINPMFGHGTGTLSILAGRDLDGRNGKSFGAAGKLSIVPIRVANWVVLFRNSAIAQAFDYVHELCADEQTRVHVLSMSMGGIASSVWADGVNALYERGVFMVTAAGNNFGNLPTRFIVYPARFDRVVAACGVMADGRPYADLPIDKMAGCYGPAHKDATSIAAYTPNVPWARFGCPDTIDKDGGGTSAATPQVAAAAALWMQKNKTALDAYSQDWMRVEAARKALFDSAQGPSGQQQGRVGRGILRGRAALDHAAASDAALANAMTPADSVSFPLLRVLTGLGMAAAPPSERQRMLELEALQISQQSHEIERLLGEYDLLDAGKLSPQIAQSPQVRQIIDAMIAHPSASAALKSQLVKAVPRSVSVRAPEPAQPGPAAPPGSPPPPPGTPAPSPSQSAPPSDLPPPSNDPIAPDVPTPPIRRLWVYARDPMYNGDMQYFDLNEVELQVPWEKDLKIGPVGEYLEVIDVDPAGGAAYVPVDLNHPSLLAQSGYKPTEGNPQFHQQMVYAVAMKTIQHFETALGRTALWAPRRSKINGNWTSHFVRRLRIYPHALREANAYYSPDRMALLFGYFRASKRSRFSLPGGIVFNCLSHDVVAHETTHALLDGLHERYKEASGRDMPAFHEAFADIVALFQHFTLPLVLRAAIRETKGKASLSESLGALAQQFGDATGMHKALRSFIRKKPNPNAYETIDEPHERGALLVSAVFAAFSRVYDRKTRDLFRLATNGTGILPDGDIPFDLVERLAVEAANVARTILTTCIRALDYCPPVDLTFGEYLRALITADRDLIPDDKDGYRVAFIAAFRERGMYPPGVSNLSVDALVWQHPDVLPDVLAPIKVAKVGWNRKSDRYQAFIDWHRAAERLYKSVIDDPTTPPEFFGALGLVYVPKGQAPMTTTIDGQTGQVSRIQIGAVRPAWRVAPDNEIKSDLIIEMTQKWVPATGEGQGQSFRGGCTLICDLDSAKVRYVIRKRVGHVTRTQEESAFRAAMAESGSQPYFTGQGEPFAMMHRDH